MIANDILVTSKDQDRNLRQHARNDADRRFCGALCESSVDVATTLGPAAGMCCGVESTDDVGSLEDGQ